MGHVPTIFLVSVFCAFTVEFVDSPFIPDWKEIFGYSAEDDESDSIYFLNVGEGDATLIKSNGRFVLIDTGDGVSTNIIKTLKSMDVKGIDALVITHWHNDHMGAAEEIMKEFQVLNIVCPKSPSEKEESYENAKAVFDNADKLGVPYTILSVGLGINVGDFRLSVLSYTPDADEENNRSAIMMARCRNSKFLLMADAESELVDTFLSDDIDIECDVIKIAHHGGKDSTNSYLINEAKPDYAVISVGAGNRYGHPSSDVLDLLNYAYIKILRTDRFGTIEFSVGDEEVTYIENQDH